VNDDLINMVVHMQFYTLNLYHEHVIQWHVVI